jgi:hypothetical protein
MSPRVTTSTIENAAPEGVPGAAQFDANSGDLIVHASPVALNKKSETGDCDASRTTSDI